MVIVNSPWKLVVIGLGVGIPEKTVVCKIQVLKRLLYWPVEGNVAVGSLNKIEFLRGNMIVGINRNERGNLKVGKVFVLWDRESLAK